MKLAWWKILSIILLLYTFIAGFTTEVPEKDGANPDAFAPLAGNKLWTSLPFVANKEIHTYDLEMIYGSPSGQYALLEKIEKALLP